MLLETIWILFFIKIQHVFQFSFYLIIVSAIYTFLLDKLLLDSFKIVALKFYKRLSIVGNGFLFFIFKIYQWIRLACYTFFPSLSVIF